MKILIPFIGFLAIFSLSYGQGASLVYDARNDINQTNNYLVNLKDFGEAVKQSQILKDTYEFYKKAQEALQKVNRTVNDFYTVQNIVKMQIASIKDYGRYVSQARGFKYISPENITTFTTKMAGLNNSINQLMKQAELILKDDYFKMSDAERLRFLSEIEEKMNEKKVLMKIRYNELQAAEEEGKLLNYYR
jgi:hypothetical protein